jgi:hypothetical protein
MNTPFASVAGFFVSRIDALVDPLLENSLHKAARKADLATRRVSGSRQNRNWTRLTTSVSPITRVELRIDPGLTRR